VGGISPVGLQSGAQIYDPATRTFASQASDIDGLVAATKLKDGRVLVAGGTTSTGPSQSAWIFDPATNAFSKVGNLSTGRQGAGSGLLPDGRVIVVGGFGPGGAINSTADIYDPKLGVFSTTQDLADYRYRGTTTILVDGSALLVGGLGKSAAPIASIETDLPAQPPNRVGTMNAGLADQTATLLKDGTVLIVGGISVGDLTTASAGLYVPQPKPAAPSVSP
jgi:hypothetical protein